MIAFLGSERTCHDFDWRYNGHGFEASATYRDV